MLIGQGQAVAGFIGLDAKLHTAGRRPRRVRHAGRHQADAHAFWGARHVPLPPRPGDCPALFEQKAITRRDPRRILGAHGGLIEAGDHPLAPVRHLHQQGAVTPRPIQGSQQGHIALKMHQAIGAPLSQRQIHHALAGSMQGVNRIMGDGLNPLVRPDIAKDVAIFVRPPLQNF